MRATPPVTSPAAPRSAPRRPFLIAALSTLLLLVVLDVAWRLFGSALVEAVRGGRIELGRRLFRAGSRHSDQQAHVLADSTIRAVLAVAYVLVATSLLAWGTRRWRWPARLVVFAAAWAALELVLAPQLVGPWGLEEFYLVRDPDHRPQARGHAELNLDGLRGTPDAADFRSEDLNLVFLGDSFVYGLHLEAHEALPARVEARLRARLPDPTRLAVANFGWVSSSPLLSWRRLVEQGERYHPDLVVLAVDMSDFHDELVYAAMIERRGLFRWCDRAPVALKLLKTCARSTFVRLKRWLNPELPERRFFMSLAPLEDTRESLWGLVESLERIQAWCEERGVAFVVFVSPRGYQYSDRESPESWERDEYESLGPYALEPFRFFEQLAPTRAYPVHSLLPAFQATHVFPTCLDWDPHWNAAGTEVAAEAVTQVLEPLVRELAGE